MAVAACLTAVVCRPEEAQDKKSSKRGVGLGLYGAGDWAASVWPSSGAGLAAAAAGAAGPWSGAGGPWSGGAPWPAASSGVGLGGWPYGGADISALHDPSNSLGAASYHDLGSAKVSIIFLKYIRCHALISTLCLLIPIKVCPVYWTA